MRIPWPFTRVGSRQRNCPHTRRPAMSCAYQRRGRNLIFRFAGLLTVTAIAFALDKQVLAADTDAHFAGPTLKVRIYNQSVSSDTDVSDMKMAVQQVFKHSGIQIVWVPCWPAVPESSARRECQEDSGPATVSLFLVNNSLKLSYGVLGNSFLGTARAVVFYERARSVAVSEDIPPGSVLGATAAHEIGHLLLASRRHSLIGVMKETLGLGEYRDLAEGRLCFVSEESHLLQHALELADVMEDSGHECSKGNPQAKLHLSALPASRCAIPAIRPQSQEFVFGREGHGTATEFTKRPAALGVIELQTRP